MIGDESIDVPVPAGASKVEEERLIQAAIDKKIDADIDDVLGGLGEAFK